MRTIGSVTTSHDVRETFNVRCSDCRAVVPNFAAHLIKANNVCGRAWQCQPCGDAELARLREFNADRGRPGEKL